MASARRGPDAGCQSLSARFRRPENPDLSVRQLTFVRPEAATPDASTLCGYDLETHRTAVLFNPRAARRSLTSAPISGLPGDAILFDGEKDLWLLDPQTGGARRLTQDGAVKEVPTFSRRVTGLPS